MFNILNKLMAKSGADWIKRARTLAEYQNKRQALHPKYEVQDGFLLKGTAFKKLGTATVMDLPGFFFVEPSPIFPGGQNGGSLIWGQEWKIRDWFNSTFEEEFETITLDESTWPGKLMTMGLLNIPSASPNPSGLFSGAVQLVPEIVSQQHASLIGAGVLLDAKGVAPSYVHLNPYGVETSLHYGINIQAYWSTTKGMWIQITTPFMQSIAGAGWEFCNYSPDENTFKVQTGVCRATHTDVQGDIFFAAVTNKQSRPGYIGDGGIPGLYLGVYSTRAVRAAYEDHPESAKMEEGLLWHKHYALADLVPTLTTGAYIANPYVYVLDRLSGGGDPEFATGLSKWWDYGYYDGDVGLTAPIGQMPLNMHNFTVVRMPALVRIICSVEVYNGIDWSLMYAGEGYEPGDRMTTVIGNGVVRIDFDFAGNLLAASVSDFDSTCGGTPEFENDPFVKDDPDPAFCRWSLVSGALCMEVTNVYVEAIGVIIEPRLIQRWFSVINTSFIPVGNDHDAEGLTPGRPFMDASSYLQINTVLPDGTPNSFQIPYIANDFFTWGPFAKYAIAPELNQFLAVKEYTMETAPEIVQISMKEVATIVYRINSPEYRMSVLIINIEDGSFQLKNLPESWDYSFPAPNTSGNSTVVTTQPPKLTVPQMAQYNADGERTMEAVLMVSFYPVFHDTIISRDTAETWNVLAENSNSRYGAFYQPNVLRTSYTYGTAARKVGVPEET